MDLLRLDVHILDLANDDSFLFELLSGVDVVHVDGETFQQHPPVPLDEARAAVMRLLAAGFVELIGEGVGRLNEEQALDAVASEEAWGYDPTHDLVITERGREALEEAWPRYFDEAGRPRTDA